MKLDAALQRLNASTLDPYLQSLLTESLMHPPKFTLSLLIFAIATAVAASPAFADVKLPALITANMVLQRDSKVPIWGMADPGEQVTVTFKGQTAASTADDQGKWSVKLGPFKAGGPFEMTIVGKNTIDLKNVMIGDVWLCSGQSNMEFTVAKRQSYLLGALHWEEEVARANYPNIRFFNEKQQFTHEPQSDTVGHWTTCTPETAATFSAIGYFYGRELNQELRIPIGLIDSAVGGTPAEAWTSKPALEADPSLKVLVDNWDAAMKVYPEAHARWQAEFDAWQAADKAARDAGKPSAGPRPWPPPLGWMVTAEPACLYNAMISPLTHFPIKGVIWYQGESNADRAYQYRKLFPAMIKDWRNAWGEGDFPFLFVQLANFAVPVQPDQNCWAELREAQDMALALPNTGEAVTIDIGEADSIHPHDKQDVAHRLALISLAKVYGKRVTWQSPRCASFSIEGNAIRIRFQKGSGDLVARGAGPLTGFEIAGADQKFVPANAATDGKTVLVTFPAAQASAPVAVRYAWADYPTCNLYNKAGLPAGPFRTDDWPGLTVNRQ